MLVKVIEEVSDTSFDDYLQTKIFTPTRMNQTAADWDSASQDLTIGYEKVDGEFIRSPADHPSHFVGAGTTYSTVDDTYRWYQAVYVDGSMREFSLGGGDGRGMDYRAVCKEGPAYVLPIAGYSPWMSCQNSGTVSWK